MKLYKFAALLLLGSVSLWAQTATKPADSTTKKAPAAAAQKNDAAREHKCACDHAKDGKKECHCKEMMASKDAEACKGHEGKDANMSKMGDHKMMAEKGCCGCCGGKCDRMKHKMDHDKAPAAKSGM